jgi:hypothetical protein
MHGGSDEESGHFAQKAAKEYLTLGGLPFAPTFHLLASFCESFPERWKQIRFAQKAAKVEPKGLLIG